MRVVGQCSAWHRAPAAASVLMSIDRFGNVCLIDDAGKLWVSYCKLDVERYVGGWCLESTVESRRERVEELWPL